MIPSSMWFLRYFLMVIVSLLSVSAGAQTVPTPPPGPAPGERTSLVDLLNSGQWKIEVLSSTHWRMTGDVEWAPPGAAFRFSADQLEIFTDTERVVASGNVVFTTAEGRLAAERVEFDVRTGTGVFHQASGILSLGPGVDRAQFGGQEPEVYFYGDTIEKVSARRYRISRGGFSTCVQPTPRWEVTSDSVTLNLDEYAVARNMLLRVKGVPLMYLPIIYYPIQDDERATGFLMPTYGASTLRGQSLSNAFFWAINRSQDATLFHDWYTRTGQGIGGEYRYQANQDSSGTLRAYRFSQQEAAFNQGGTINLLPARQSYQVLASMTQSLGRSVRARARVDYFSDVATQQLYQQNVHYATRASRVVEGGVSAGAGWISSSVQYLRSEVFDTATRSIVYGSTPRVTASVAPQRLFGTPIYASLNSDYAYLPYRDIDAGVIRIDNSLGRLDVRPSLRVPLSRLSFLSVTQTATSQTTYYTRSLNDTGTIGDDSLIRRSLSVRTDIIGPVFNRIWDTPESRSAQRRKHVIEPAFSVDYITEIENQNRVPLLSDVSDFVVGGATRVQYGVNNRLFSRGRAREGAQGGTREVLTIALFQTYYSNPLASRFDTTYVSATGRPGPVDLSPVTLTARVSPAAGIDANARLEYDVSGNGLQILTAGTSAQIVSRDPTTGVGGGPEITANVSFSRYRYSPAQTPNTYLSMSTNSRWLQGRVAGTYALSWDISRSYVQSQSVMASYMAQCCGIQADFQTVNYPGGLGFPIPSDRRFNFSFVLAGLGTFSNFFGAFGQR